MSHFRDHPSPEEGRINHSAKWTALVGFEPYLINESFLKSPPMIRKHNGDDQYCQRLDDMTFNWDETRSVHVVCSRGALRPRHILGHLV